MQQWQFTQDVYTASAKQTLLRQVKPVKFVSVCTFKLREGEITTLKPLTEEVNLFLSKRIPFNRLVSAFLKLRNDYR